MGVLHPAICGIWWILFVLNMTFTVDWVLNFKCLFEADVIWMQSCLWLNVKKVSFFLVECCFCDTPHPKQTNKIKKKKNVIKKKSMQCLKKAYKLFLGTIFLFFKGQKLTIFKTFNSWPLALHLYLFPLAGISVAFFRVNLDLDFFMC